MNNQYPMIDGGPVFRISDIGVFKRRFLSKIKRIEGNAKYIDYSDNLKDSKFKFEEFPRCESCGTMNNFEVLTAMDGNRIVECAECGLWYTSPRINESLWNEWLLEDNKRNYEFTENRLKYGCALSRNIPLSFSFWWRITRKRRQTQIKRIIAMLDRKCTKIHDVGCGCGYLLKSVQDIGIDVSGNDLNQYAVRRIRELFGMNVHVGKLPDLVKNGILKESCYDIIYMNDYIEHTYHPSNDIKTSYKMLRKGGILYVRTFCVDSEKFKHLKENWDMFMWNHCYHFTTNSLSKIVSDSKFDIIKIDRHENTGVIEIYARK